MIDALARHALAGDRVRADDTPVPVFAPGARKIKAGRLWTYLRDERPYAGEAAPAAKCGRRRTVTVGQLAAPDVASVMDAIERAVPTCQRLN